MSQAYQIVGKRDRLCSEQLAAMLRREGQWLLPLVGLIEQAQCAVDEAIERSIAILAMGWGRGSGGGGTRGGTCVDLVARASRPWLAAGQSAGAAGDRSAIEPRRGDE